MTSGRRLALRSWLAALLLVPVLAPATGAALAAARSEDGCGCAGMACCRRAPERSCCPGSAAGACSRRAHGGGARFTVGCGCEHPAPVGSASAREQPALLGAVAGLAPPAPAIARAPRPAPPESRPAGAPDPPPPRPHPSLAAR